LGGSGHSRLLKILHIDPERNWGGGEAQVFGLLTYLAEKGHQNDLLTHPHGKLFTQSQKLNVRARALVARNDLDLRAILPLRGLIRKEQYDIVHLHTKRAHALSVWLPHGSVAPKYVVTRRMDYPVTKGWTTRQLYNHRADGVIAISKAIAELLTEGGVDPQKIRLIHSGVDAHRFDSIVGRAHFDSNVAIVGSMAVMEERKGHRYLLEAARLLKDRGHRIKYLLAGDGSLKSALEKTVIALGLSHEVNFVGFVSDVPLFLAGLDIFVMPSLFEGLGVAVLEAMAAGKAVVATNVGGLVESVSDSVTGFLVPPRDSKALADALAKLVGDEMLSREMGKRGAERVREHFSLEEMARRNEAYYYALLEENA
jgi:glycosyltransferase involved in cell wall biosynthesis